MADHVERYSVRGTMSRASMHVAAELEFVAREGKSSAHDLACQFRVEQVICQPSSQRHVQSMACGRRDTGKGMRRSSTEESGAYPRQTRRIPHLQTMHTCPPAWQHGGTVISEQCFLGWRSTPPGWALVPTPLPCTNDVLLAARTTFKSPPL